mmetsp:Transcript_57727/g.137381  ORF Transcript_57727/g.137381 Transcript_57727/m.137381 type:complete len:1425 (+) Transcript_57727:75-4349(+)
MLRLVLNILAASCIFLPHCSALTNLTACYAYFGYVSDLGFTYSQNLARAWVDAELQMQSRYVEGVGLSDRARQVSVMDDFISTGCDVIVVGSNVLQGIMLEYADVHPELKFICLTCHGVERPNLATIEIMTHQPSYISGIVAALQDGVERLAYVGSNYVPGSLRNLNAFALGAFSVRPNITMLVTHVGSWYDPRTERIVAKRLIEQYGADVLAYDSDSTEVVQVAKELNRLSIAAKVDGTATHGETNLMSRVRQWNAPLLATMEAAAGVREWALHKDDNANVGFAENAVTLGTFSSRVSLEARVKALQEMERFTNHADTTFCVPDGQTGIRAFCPRDANISSPEMGNVAPNSVFPCDVPETGIVPTEAGNCLSFAQERAMPWMVEGYIDLGLVRVPDECARGTRMDFKSAELCVPCEPGRISLVTDTEQCELCAEGRFSRDGSECQLCPPGQYSGQRGSSVCEECPEGTFASVAGFTLCTDCEEGKFANSTGKERCDRCPSGTYQADVRGTNCTACPEGETTLFNAASSHNECICPAGTYRDGGGVCKTCPEGMLCESGSDVRNFPGSPTRPDLSLCMGEASCSAHPRTLEGYMSLPEDPLRIYKCASPEACPGAPPGLVSKCGVNRPVDEVACGVCQNDAFENRAGNCEKCSGDVEVVTFIAVILMGLVALAVLAAMVNRDLLLQGNGTLTVVIVTGILLTAVQTTIVFNQMSIEWVDPLKAAIKFGSSVLTVNLNDLKLGCYVPVSPVSSYFGSQIIAPACLPVITLCVLVKRFYFKKVAKAGMLAEIANACGTIFSVFFIAVVISAVEPLICYPHPPGGGSSMTNEPAVLCWDTDERHHVMLFLALASFLLVPVNFLSACIYAVYKHPQFMAVNDDRQRWWLHSFRFLFFRFKPGCHMFGILLLLRNLVLCLIPAVLPGDMRGVQVAVLLAVLLTSGYYQTALAPFATWVGNLVDSFTSGILILILALGMLRTEIEITDTDILVLSTLVLCLGIIGILAGVAVGLRTMCMQTARYQFFLSHHKAAAAAQARYMQMLLQLQTRRTCFLDSDHLVDLGLLFDTVKTSVAQFLIFLTRHTLTRPWCVGEIVIAMESKLPTTKIVSNTFQAPSVAELEKIDNYLPQRSELVDYHIDSDNIIEALRKIVSSDLPEILVRFDIGGTQVFHMAVQEIAGASRKPTMVSFGKAESDALVISTDMSDQEATAAGAILEMCIRERVTMLLPGGAILLADMLPLLQEEQPEEDTHEMSLHLGQCLREARAVVVVLTSQSLQSQHQIEVIMASAQRCLIPVCTPQFQFPGKSYYDTMLPVLAGESLDLAADALKHFFEHIAVPLTTHASRSILQAEASRVVLRVPLRAASKEKDDHVQLSSSVTVTFSTTSKDNSSQGNRGSPSDVPTGGVGLAAQAEGEEEAAVHDWEPMDV